MTTPKKHPWLNTIAREVSRAAEHRAKKEKDQPRQKAACLPPVDFSEKEAMSSDLREQPVRVPDEHDLVGYGTSFGCHQPLRQDLADGEDPLLS
jgi:hypothetical protein